MTNNDVAIQVVYQGSAMMWANIKMEWLFIKSSYDTGIMFYINGSSQHIQLDHVFVTQSSFGLHILAHSKQSHIAITNSSFYNNNQTGIRLVVTDNTSGTFLLDSSQFKNNSGIFGTSLQAVVY
uniref:Right handed beta helix domain-containing protein n=1 Tax=Amphimedon queenslandica TaxID=400682 RepID=A0A1X7US10_AMPQE